MRTTLAILLFCAAAASQPIDTERSTLTVRVYKSGVFSAFAHDHEIRAPIEEGEADFGAKTVRLRVKAGATNWRRRV